MISDSSDCVFGTSGTLERCTLGLWEDIGALERHKDDKQQSKNHKSISATQIFFTPIPKFFNDSESLG